MKYLTRQWFHDSQKWMIEVHFKVSDEAKEFSEEYFQRLYQEQIKDCMTRYLTRADEYDLKRRSAEEQAADYYSRQLLYINPLPDEIKDSIADIRVAALGFVTREILDKIKIFCENIKAQAQSKFKEYQNYCETIKDNIPQIIWKSLSKQNESHIKRIGALNGDYIIETHTRDRDYIFTFRNASLRQDITKADYLTWIYSEIYVQDGGYETHILFHALFNPPEQNQMISLTDVIIYAEAVNIEIIENEPVKFYTEFL